MPGLFQSLSIYVSFAFNVVLHVYFMETKQTQLQLSPFVSACSIQQHCILSLSSLYILRIPQFRWNLIDKFQASSPRLAELRQSFLENQLSLINYRRRQF